MGLLMHSSCTLKSVCAFGSLHPCGPITRSLTVLAFYNSLNGNRRSLYTVTGIDHACALQTGHSVHDPQLQYSVSPTVITPEHSAISSG